MINTVIDLFNRRQEEREALIAGQETLQKHIAEQKGEIERYLHSIRLLEQDVKAAREELKEFKTMTVDEVAKMGIKAFAERMEKMISISAAQKPYFDDLVKKMT